MSANGAIWGCVRSYFRAFSEHLVAPKHLGRLWAQAPCTPGTHGELWGLKEGVAGNVPGDLRFFSV